MTPNQALSQLERRADPSKVEGMKRFGIVPELALGVRVPDVREVAKLIGKDHELAQALWKTKIHEARLLAAIDEPAKVTDRQLELWVRDLRSWDICDCFCGDLVDKTSFARAKIEAWAGREEEFVKRAAFSTLATLAVHDKQADDAVFRAFFPLIVREADDARDLVKKAINWALRQVGKRNRRLNGEAIAVALEVQKRDTPSARWIAADALRELKSDAVQARLRQRVARAPKRPAASPRSRRSP